jgi:hypothetical protein
MTDQLLSTVRSTNQKGGSMTSDWVVLTMRGNGARLVSHVGARHILRVPKHIVTTGKYHVACKSTGELAVFDADPGDEKARALCTGAQLITIGLRGICKLFDLEEPDKGRSFMITQEDDGAWIVAKLRQRNDSVRSQPPCRQRRGSARTAETQPE